MSGGNDLFESTIQREPDCADLAADDLWIALTLLGHPDLARVGERAFLGRLAAPVIAHVSRATPELAAPGAKVRAPLGDRSISRRPLVLVGGPDGNVILQIPPEVELRVDGVSVTDRVTIDCGRLREGVVLELASRVVLLLHLLRPERARAPRLELVGDSDGIEAVRMDVLRVADLPVPVLLLGESGTGKELVAHAIHAASERARRPFLAVNMATLPPTTAASELFGHTRGAFTGAVSDRAGLFARADGGTLFLDELGDTPPDVQPMLLRVLETGTLLPLGSARPEPVDVRVIAATDVDLERAIQERSFRAALFHRLSSFPIHLPPLRARRDDVGRLFVHFLKAELAALGASHWIAAPPSGGPTWLPAELFAALARHPWPGNVRELRNVVKQLVIASRAGVARVEVTLSRLAAPTAPGAATPPRAAPAAHRPSRQIDEATLAAALRNNEFRPGAAAAELGISRTTLYALMERASTVRKARSVTADEIAACRAACGGDIDEMARRLEVSARALKLRLRELENV